MEDSDRKMMQEEINRLENEIFILRTRLAEHNNLTEQLRQAQKMEALATLASGIAHDFNNVLQTILGYIQLLLIKRTEDDPDYKTLTQIEDIVYEGSVLTKQFLTFGRKVERKCSPLDLNANIKKIKKLLSRTIPKMIHIDLRLAGELKMINADAGHIEQVLMNLSLNAKDAMPDGGTLSFKTENIIYGEKNASLLSHPNAMPGEYVRLSVSDTGLGMSPGTLERIFNPFFTTKETEKGTGLGLSMVYTIVKDHNGFIECASQIGGGTTFKIYFPVLASESRTEPDSDAAGKDDMIGGGETILLVDDEVDILKSCKEILQKFGYSVFTAIDGEDAVGKYIPEAVDLVILDVGMQGMGGVRCLRKILSINQNAKILLSSGYSFNVTVKEGLELGAKGFLAKPYTITELLRTVRNLLDAA